MLAAVELYPDIPMTMHQDHGNSVATCESAIENGFTSVMMDGSLEEDGKTCAARVIHRDTNKTSESQIDPDASIHMGISSVTGVSFFAST